MAVSTLPARLTSCSLLLLALLVALPSLARAEEEAEARGEVKSFIDEGPGVRRKLLYRSTRLEVQPLVGITLNDPFTRNVMAGANVAFHLNNSLGIGVTGAYGVSQMSTGLRDNIRAELDGRGDRLNELNYSYLGWIVDVEATYVPLFGKLSLLNSLIANYDFHLLLGVGFIGEQAVNAGSGLEVNDNIISSNTVAPMIGAGFRFFVGDMVSINLDLRDYIFSRAESNSRGSAQEELSNNFMLSLGVSIFLPGDVKVSR